MADHNNTLEEGAGSSGDIEQEQGIMTFANTDGPPPSPSEAAAITGGTSTNCTTATGETWLPGGLENVDEYAAPVPLMQQMAGMEIEKEEEASTEYASNPSPSQLPTIQQGAMLEQIEDEDDAEPRPFNSAEFEDESKPEIDFGTESNDGDDGPPLPLTFQRDSLTDADELKVAASQISASNSYPHEATTPNDVAESNDNETTGGDPDPEDDVQQVMDDQSPGDEENLQQRFVAPENNTTSDDEDVDQVLPTAAAERNPPLHIPVAWVVDDTPPQAVVNPSFHDAVYEATPLEPWWKQRRIKVMLVIFCVLITALTAVVGVTLPRSPGAGSVDKPMGFSPSQSPLKRNYACFADRDRLKSAINQYAQTDCNKGTGFCPADIVDEYGWPIGSWCVDEVTDMASLFEGLGTFDEDISGWNVGQVTTMNRMFLGATSFNQNLSSWNTSSVTNTREMFRGATSFNQNLCVWEDTFPYSNAKDIFVDSGCNIKGNPSSVYRGPFCASYCNEISPTHCFTTLYELKAAVDLYAKGLWGEDDSSKYGWPIGSWCVGNVTDMSELFRDLRAFNEDISGWNVGQVTSMYGMFWIASSFTQDLSRWDTSLVTTMAEMFLGASSFNGDISAWNTSALTDMSYMFLRASSFNQEDLSRWDTSAVTNMSGMFYKASSFNGDISSWNTSAVTDMNGMFTRASSFNQEDLSRWDTSAVTDMSGMFYNAPFFNGDISSWNTSAVQAMNSMFKGASSFNGNISSWNTAAVTDMSYMFWGASSFNQEDLSRWDTSAVNTMEAMFAGASSFNGDISSWNTSAVTYMSFMFWA